MKTHDCELECPRCEGSLALTTEWGWIDAATCTATLCCPECRTEQGWSDDAVEVCHAATEAEALAGVMSSAEELVERLAQDAETEPAS